LCLDRTSLLLLLPELFLDRISIAFFVPELFLDRISIAFFVPELFLDRISIAFFVPECFRDRDSFPERLRTRGSSPNSFFDADPFRDFSSEFSLNLFSNNFEIILIEIRKTNLRTIMYIENGRKMIFLNQLIFVRKCYLHINVCTSQLVL
jgi:hypothetical protein